MTVTLSQKSYDALLDDLEKLRERNAELERKLDKEIKLSYEIEKNLYDTSKERDELINDIADIKRKAEAFDEVLVCAVGNAMDVGDEVNKIVEEYYKERGSDE